jgi:hypothetical protein
MAKKYNTKVTELSGDQLRKVLIHLNSFHTGNPLWKRKGIREFLLFMHTLTEKDVRLLDAITPDDGHIKGNRFTRPIWREIRDFEKDVGFRITEGDRLLPVFEKVARAGILGRVDYKRKLPSGRYYIKAEGFSSKIASTRSMKSGVVTKDFDPYDELYDLLGVEGPDFSNRPKAPPVTEVTEAESTSKARQQEEDRRSKDQEQEGGRQA